MSWRPRVIPGGAGASPPEGEGREPSDADLVQVVLEARAAGGGAAGPAAFAELVKRHESKVLSVAWHLTGSSDDARDVAQDAFLRAWRSLESFRPDQSFRNWLLKIAVNAAHDHRARRRFRLFQPVEAAEHLDSGHDPEQEADHALQAERVLRAVEHLAPREREVFVLRDLEGLAVEEVARLLGVAEPTVRRHLALARLRLRELLSSRD